MFARTLFDQQRAAFRRSALSYKDRMDALRTLERALIDHKDEIVRAIAGDFDGRAAEETLLLEVVPTLGEIRDASAGALLFRFEKFAREGRAVANHRRRSDSERLHLPRRPDGLPFGGIGPSGTGHYHGYHGFETFSKKKGVFVEGRWTPLSLLRPPYGGVARKILGFLMRS